MAPRIETAEDLERIVAEQTAAITAMGELVKGMDARIREQDAKLALLIALVDGHHDVMVKAGLAPPRPKVDPRAN